ncbi:MAG: PD40 domain-containing protein [Chloroflexi bacterium]|nr:PD40 domain-containing protein [Chloroflexota bacterium]
MFTKIAVSVGVILILAALGCSSPASSILFTSDRDGNLEIYSVNVNGEKLTNLTNTQTHEFAPVLSPNHRLVSFLSGVQGNTAVEVMRVDGTERFPLTQGGAEHSSQRWSPSNDRIAYVRQDGSNSNIYVSSVGESKTALLTSISGHQVGDWSRDGNSVTFAVLGGPNQGIYVRNPDGVNEFRVTETPDYNPTWSPDSRRLAFLSTRDGNPEIYVMDADGNNLKRLTESEAPEYDISWSPNGQSILFVSERDGNPEIYTMTKDGARPTRLTFNTTVDNQPVWSPGGKQIAFVSYLDGDADIFIMSIDGKSQKRLTNNSAQDTNPAW